MVLDEHLRDLLNKFTTTFYSVKESEKIPFFLFENTVGSNWSIICFWPKAVIDDVEK